MQPLNPFLAAFFRPGNPVLAQCSPVHHHILLVPTTEFLLTSRETESGSSPAELIVSEDFLGSHVLRIPASAATAGGKDGVGNLREMRGKARQYSTVNGRSIVIKDASIYTNKGFKSLAQAQLLSDSIWYADTIEPRQWLVYYISQPLVGTWEAVQVPPAIFTEGMARKKMAEANQASAVENGEPSMPRKKEIKSFHDLFNNFPIIARHMQPGLEKLFAEFTTAFERPLPPPPSAAHIPDPVPDGPITAAMNRIRSNSTSSLSLDRDVRAAQMVTENFFAEDDEDVMRTALETAITSAIDLFQSVDKQQLSMLGATTDLTGPIVERLIEKYVTENVHNLIWARLAAVRRPDDLELEAKIRQMEFIDISQLGLPIEGGSRGKQELIVRLLRAVDEFRKMSGALSPQDMLELLLSTMKTLTQLTEQPRPELQATAQSEKPILTINADTLVSLLLYVVIRAGVKHLQARLLYVRHFIFIEDVDSGEMGYALSTFEAVLSYLLRDSSNLRKASRRNKALWDATARGSIADLKRIMDPYADDAIEEELPESPISSHAPSVSWSMLNGSRRSSTAASEPYSQGSGLAHVFPFESSRFEMPKKIKKVAMDTRSMSSGSEFSWHSRAPSIGTIGSGLEGDTSLARLCQTQDSFGESVLMMAIQNERPESLEYLLSLEEYFPIGTVLEDRNNEATTLLSAAVQLGHTKLIATLLDFIMPKTSEPQIRRYLALQDTRGRSVAHYLFQAPSLIARIGHLVPWRQKDKNGQTPLFALARSYDHTNYRPMVAAGLEAATEAQVDGQALHLDDHVDSKGNSLLHIMSDAQLALEILQRCNVDTNATNEKRFTPLMVASKYGRFEMVRALYSDPRVDVGAKELRGFTAVELAKDDDVRNRIDDLTLFSMPSNDEARVTGVVRSFFVEDATIRLVLKSGAPADDTSFTVTTCRRSMADFERLANLLAIENPASWIPIVAPQRSPFQIPSKPSRAVLKEYQMRTDWFLKIMLSHPTFATHELLWEFFLVPDLQADMMEQRSRLKAETRAEKVRDELEPLENLREVEQFVEYSRDMVRSINYSTKSVARRTNASGVVAYDLYEAANLLARGVSKLAFLPASHTSAVEIYARSLLPSQASPPVIYHSSMIALQSTIQAMLSALSRPPQLIAQIISARKSVERSYNTLSRSTRWPLGLLDETRQRMNEEREEKARRTQTEVENLGKELRYSQQVVASELAGWKEMHERMGRKAIRELARGMIIQERMRLDGLKRALRRLRAVPEVPAGSVPVGDARSSPSPAAPTEGLGDTSASEVPTVVVGSVGASSSGGESSAMGAAIGDAGSAVDGAL